MQRRITSAGHHKSHFYTKQTQEVGSSSRRLPFSEKSAVLDWECGILDRREGGGDGVLHQRILLWGSKSFHLRIKIQGENKQPRKSSKR